ncbi:uncharacterized protein [Anoplolepis gracilipes]|uniref:uncharacterized protein n=1 Tax=Anoplolepis gracilipes TaxID=354296 RepID=UPI003BA2DCB9
MWTVLLSQIKYLGLHIDGRWSFACHFDRLVPRAEKAAAAISRLLPNLGGPDGRVRRVYAHTVLSILMYAAPVWAGEAIATRRIQDAMRRVQRRLAIRLVRGYRTVSHAAATILAGLPPLHMFADSYRRLYDRKSAARRRGVAKIPARILGTWKLQEKKSLEQRWIASLHERPPTSGERTNRPSCPVWRSGWTGRGATVHSECRCSPDMGVLESTCTASDGRQARPATIAVTRRTPRNTPSKHAQLGGTRATS